MANTFTHILISFLITAIFLLLTTFSPEVAFSSDTASALPSVQASDLSETKSLISAIFKVVSSLIVVVALMLGVVFLLKKFGINKGLQSSSIVKVIETKMVAPKKYIAIVEIAGKTLSVGVTDHNINMLTELDDSAVKKLQTSQEDTISPKITNKFESFLAKATGRKA